MIKELIDLFTQEVRYHSLYTYLDKSDIINSSNIYFLCTEIFNEDFYIEDFIYNFIDFYVAIKSKSLRDYLLANLYELFVIILNIQIEGDYRFILQKEKKIIAKIMKELNMINKEFILLYYEYNDFFDELAKYHTRETQSIILQHIINNGDIKITPSILKEIYEELDDHISDVDKKLLKEKMNFFSDILVNNEMYLQAENLKIITEEYDI